LGRVPGKEEKGMDLMEEERGNEGKAVKGARNWGTDGEEGICNNEHPITKY